MANRMAGLRRAGASGRAHGARGARSRSELLLKLAGAENGLILAVNVLAVNVLAVNVLAVNGALHALYSVQKCLRHSI